MKRELRSQFLPVNVAWQAQAAIHLLKQAGSISDYIKAFSRHLLEVRNILEDDKLFNFMSGVQSWA
uniref:Retrotransposon gag domain-containing protein n=1 Tax=Nymphaea colorata TaxID=210225 RepID=A0A5K0YEU7_9MAGN|nr:unnamed protein product [Nymphaea colorata]